VTAVVRRRETRRGAAGRRQRDAVPAAAFSTGSSED